MSSSILPVKPRSSIKLIIPSTISIAALILVFVWLIKEHSLLDSRPEPFANEAMLPSSGPNEFRKPKMFAKDATASGLSDSVRLGLDKRLLNVLACSVTLPCISPTSSWIATRDAAKVEVPVVVEKDAAKEDVDPGLEAVVVP